MRAVTALGITFLAVMFLAACGGQTAESPAENAPLASGALIVDNVSANLTLPTATGAVYMRITNGTDQDDALLGANVPGCGLVELHEMVMDGDIMRMNPVEGGHIPIPAGQTVMLERGGLHVMCMDKTGTYTVGDTVAVTLQFANAGTIEVSATVVDPGEMSDMGNVEMGAGE